MSNHFKEPFKRECEGYEWRGNVDERGEKKTHIYFSHLNILCEKAHKNDVFMDDYKFMSYLLWFSFIHTHSVAQERTRGWGVDEIWRAIFNSQIDISHFAFVDNHKSRTLSCVPFFPM